MNLYDIIDKFEYRHGNIFEQNDLNYIAHQCNCFHCMGAGVAAQIAKKYPIVAEQDKLSICGDKNKLGSIQIINVKDYSQNLTGIINMYSQYNPGCYKTKYEYNERLTAIENCLSCVKSNFENSKTPVTIGFPYLIGCGISGLKEDDVIKIFNKIFENNKESNIKIVFVDFNKTFDIYEQMEFDWNEERNDAQIESISNF